MKALIIILINTYDLSTLVDLKICRRYGDTRNYCHCGVKYYDHDQDQEDKGGVAQLRSYLGPK